MTNNPVNIENGFNAWAEGTYVFFGILTKLANLLLYTAWLLLPDSNTGFLEIKSSDLSKSNCVHQSLTVIRKWGGI